MKYNKGFSEPELLVLIPLILLCVGGMIYHLRNLDAAAKHVQSVFVAAKALVEKADPATPTAAMTCLRAGLPAKDLAILLNDSNLRFIPGSNGGTATLLRQVKQGSDVDGMPSAVTTATVPLLLN